MNKITIIGGSGTGKTTLATNLSLDLKLPVYHLDAFNYYPNWQERNKGERDKLILEKIKEDKWVIDGTYTSTLEERLNMSDLVIYLDYSTFAQIKGVLSRYFSYGGKNRKEIPGCNEKLDIKFLFWVLCWRKRKRHKIMEYVKNIDHDKLLIFKNRRQLNKWYQKKFNKKISL